MKKSIFGLVALLAVSSSMAAKPFVEYDKKVEDYLKRIQHGSQTYAYDPSKDFTTWQTEARAALIELIGLQRMRDSLSDFKPHVEMGKAEKIDGQFTRALCSIETEPGVVIPFYLLIPISDDPEQRFPLMLCPHGHDIRGLHSYAGVFEDRNHEREILEKDGNIAELTARRGYAAIAPATRGLAKEVMIPDPNGRHGNRPCRAQLMHCLLAGRTPVAERVWDMQCLLDWAEQQPQIDMKRVGMTGNSGGGVLTAYTAAIDPRIKAAIPSCSFSSATSSTGYIFLCDCCMVPGLRNWGGWREIGGLIAPRYLLIVHGKKDHFHSQQAVEETADAVAEIYKAAGVPDRVKMEWGPDGHRFYPKIMWPFIETAFGSEN